MLKNTFIHLPGIGEQTERRFWREGITTWSDALSCNDSSFLKRHRKEKFKREIEKSFLALEREDAAYFQQCLHGRNAWRGYPEFSHKVLFLDIETTGGGVYDTAVTMVGVYDGYDYTPFIAGKNLYDFPDALDDAKLLVTFYGSGFDLPVLKSFFPRANWSQLHVDLCFTLKQLGLHGGLKKVEHTLNLQRDPDVEGMTGYDAVKLWYAYLRGNENALEILIKYNKEDVCNLKVLVEYGYQELKNRTLDAPAIL